MGKFLAFCETEKHESLIESLMNKEIHQLIQLLVGDWLNQVTPSDFTASDGDLVPLKLNGAKLLD